MTTLRYPHLDLGAGATPLIAYRQRELYGVDLRDMGTPPGVEPCVAKIMHKSVPWPFSDFAPVWAFDFREHEPSLLSSAHHGSTRFPVVASVDENWRVPAPGGRLCPLAPAYPSVAVFVGSAGVNFDVAATPEDFRGDALLAAIYGLRNVVCCAHGCSVEQHS